MRRIIISSLVLLAGCAQKPQIRYVPVVHTVVINHYIARTRVELRYRPLPASLLAMTPVPDPPALRNINSRTLAAYMSDLNGGLLKCNADLGQIAKLQR